MTAASEDLKERVKALWLVGVSATDIAVTVNAEFGGARSRSAILGMVHRMRLRDGSAQRSPAHRSAPSERPQARAKKAAAPNLSPAPLPIVTLAPPVVVEEAAPAAGSVPFSGDFPARSCRWPVGGAGFSMTICGATQREGSSYCKAHHRIAYVPAERRRAA